MRSRRALELELQQGQKVYTCCIQAIARRPLSAGTDRSLHHARSTHHQNGHQGRSKSTPRVHFLQRQVFMRIKGLVALSTKRSDGRWQPWSQWSECNQHTGSSACKIFIQLGAIAQHPYDGKRSSHGFSRDSPRQVPIRMAFKSGSPQRWCVRCTSCVAEGHLWSHLRPQTPLVRS